MFDRLGSCLISTAMSYVGLCCNRTLSKRLYSAKETYNFKACLFVLQCACLPPQTNKPCMIVDIHIDICGYPQNIYVDIHKQALYDSGYKP